MQAKTINCTAPDGHRYSCEVVVKWGKRYYSLDGGATEHRSAKAARLDAIARGIAISLA